jgi:hypothetical protein
VRPALISGRLPGQPAPFGPKRASPSKINLHIGSLGLKCVAANHEVIEPHRRESQRDSATKPRVASSELPWESRPTISLNLEEVVPPHSRTILSRDKGRRTMAEARRYSWQRHNSFGVEAHALIFPRVASPELPWERRPTIPLILEEKSAGGG